MALTLISTPLDITVSDTAVATVSVTSGITSTYDSYQFHFVSMHPSADSKKMRMIASADSGSSYGIATTTTVFSAYHSEGDAGGTLEYNTSTDAEQSTSEVIIGDSTGNDADQACSGIMTLYAPSSSTHVKHFMTKFHQSSGGDYSNLTIVGGYINTASAIDAIKFSFDSGNIDAGTIKMYGVK